MAVCATVSTLACSVVCWPMRTSEQEMEIVRYHNWQGEGHAHRQREIVAEFARWNGAA